MIILRTKTYSAREEADKKKKKLKRNINISAAATGAIVGGLGGYISAEDSVGLNSRKYRDLNRKYSSDNAVDVELLANRAKGSARSKLDDIKTKYILGRTVGDPDIVKNANNDYQNLRNDTIKKFEILRKQHNKAVFDDNAEQRFRERAWKIAKKATNKELGKAVLKGAAIATPAFLIPAALYTHKKYDNKKKK